MGCDKNDVFQRSVLVGRGRVTFVCQTNDCLCSVELNKMCVCASVLISPSQLVIVFDKHTKMHPGKCILQHLQVYSLAVFFHLLDDSTAYI